MHVWDSLLPLVYPQDVLKPIIRTDFNLFWWWKKGRNKSFESHFSLCSLLTSSSISLILVRLNSVGHCFDWIFNCDRRTSAWPRKLGARFKCAFIDSNMYSVWVGVLGGGWEDVEKKEKKRNISSIIPIPNEGYLKWIISPPDGFELVWNFLHR